MIRSAWAGIGLSLLGCGNQGSGVSTQDGGASHDAIASILVDAAPDTASNGDVAVFPAHDATSHADAGADADGPGDATSARDASAPHDVAACPSLSGSATGNWENITPPQLQMATWCTPAWTDQCPGPGDTSSSGELATYGANAFVIDPNNTANIFLGTSQLGIWKSRDCGATWNHIDTGRNGSQLDQGRQWTMVMDPTNSDVLYTCAGYGPPGLFKSTDGGVDWDQMFTPDIITAFQDGFVEKITMDPTDPTHLVVSAHGACIVNGSASGCLAETHDGGTTWTLTNSAFQGTEGAGQDMATSETWFFGAPFNPLYRTTDGGGTWTEVYPGQDISGTVYTAADGTFYSCGGYGVFHSADGVSWALLPDSPKCGGNSNGGSSMVGDGQTLFVSDATGDPAPIYWTASESNPTTWTVLNTPASMSDGGHNLHYDPDHHLLYSSNMVAGFWRIVIQ